MFKYALGQSNFKTVIPEATCASLNEATQKGLKNGRQFSYLCVVLDKTLLRKSLRARE